MSPPAGTTALVVAFPEVEPVVGDLRARYDASAALGVPPHVTVLFPFLAPAAVDGVAVAGEVAEALAAIARGCPRFGVTFGRCGRFPGTVYLEPWPAEPFVALTRAVWHRWPSTPPYGGAFGDDVVPHLTVGHDQPPGVLDDVEERVTAALPVTAEATALTLLAFEGSRWREEARFDLGPPYDGRADGL